ncbi:MULTISPECIES: Crp/Fnr family transcriptional regulator [unclassified Roseovarius]|uniref:Crp/Fnr family transcriptional regulator n=1 Tax=unclassified Roseovarius TaxID=2614913 RepID=UPI00273E0010|nr:MULTISPECIES: Crp/Fnr family transcriptional regulator [unclassified Roseovarius]
MIRAQDREIALTSLLLRNMPERAADLLLSGAATRDYSRGETVFLQGEKATSVHIVLGGWVKLYRIAPNGNEAVVSVFSRSQSFGEAVAFRNEDYPVSAEAATDCRLLQLRAQSFIDMMKHEPELCVSLLSAIFKHLHELVGQVEHLKAQTGAQRAAEFLLDLCSNETGACVVTLPYDKVLIAGRLGMKPESLSRAFSKLRTAGVRITKNHASIEDVERLRVYAEKDRAETWTKAL